MNGTIEAESVEGRGSIFSVEFILAKSRTKISEPDSAKFGRAVARPASDASAEQRIVLYIEDNASNLVLVERILHKRPAIKLISDRLGQQALPLTLKYRPDVVLLDLHLPDISGEEALQQLKGCEETSAIPVVIVTADAIPVQADRLMRAGAAGYLNKPLQVAEVFVVIDRMTRPGKQKSQLSEPMTPSSDVSEAIDEIVAIQSDR